MSPRDSTLLTSKLVVADDKEGPNSVFQKEVVDVCHLRFL